MDAAEPVGLAVERLNNPIQKYAWGSLTAIPALLGRPSDGIPQAELWLGAHPVAPSRLSNGTSLEELIAKAPERLLGSASFTKFGPTLPFLFKVLAAGQPLSLQAHPSLAQAREGFAREERWGLSRSAPNRNYRDANHKPEILCALSEFTALCGFRRAADSVRLLRGLGLDTTQLERDGLRAYFQKVMTLPQEEQAVLVDWLVDAAERPVRGFEEECRLVVELGRLYPQDIGILGALLLNLVTLQPGEALYLDAGNLHSYVEGTGVELMANSDNVLRGGLTPKHVDVPELLWVLNFEEGPPRVLRPSGEAEAVYETPAPDFRLARIEVKGNTVTLPSRGAQVLLVVEGGVTVKQVGEDFEETRGRIEAKALEKLERPPNSSFLRKGESVFIGADEGTVEISGRGIVFRATSGTS